MAKRQVQIMVPKMIEEVYCDLHPTGDEVKAETTDRSIEIGGYKVPADLCTDCKVFISHLEAYAAAHGQKLVPPPRGEVVPPTQPTPLTIASTVKKVAAPPTQTAQPPVPVPFPPAPESFPPVPEDPGIDVSTIASLVCPSCLGRLRVNLAGLNEHAITHGYRNWKKINWVVELVHGGGRMPWSKEYADALEAEYQPTPEPEDVPKGKKATDKEPKGKKATGPGLEVQQVFITAIGNKTWIDDPEAVWCAGENCGPDRPIKKNSMWSHAQRMHDGAPTNTLTWYWAHKEADRARYKCGECGEVVAAMYCEDHTDKKHGKHMQEVSWEHAVVPENAFVEYPPAKPAIKSTPEAQTPETKKTVPISALDGVDLFGRELVFCEETGCKNPGPMQAANRAHHAGKHGKTMSEVIFSYASNRDEMYQTAEQWSDTYLKQQGVNDPEERKYELRSARNTHGRAMVRCLVPGCNAEIKFHERGPHGFEVHGIASVADVRYEPTTGWKKIFECAICHQKHPTRTSLASHEKWVQMNPDWTHAPGGVHPVTVGNIYDKNGNTKPKEKWIPASGPIPKAGSGGEVIPMDRPSNLAEPAF